MVVGTVEGAGDRAGSEGEQSMMLGKLEGAGDRAGSEGGWGALFLARPSDPAAFWGVSSDF